MNGEIAKRFEKQKLMLEEKEHHRFNKYVMLVDFVLLMVVSALLEDYRMSAAVYTESWIVNVSLVLLLILFAEIGYQLHLCVEGYVMLIGERWSDRRERNRHN